MPIDIRLVECFTTIAAEGSFTRAAQALGVAQSGVSERLSRLEAILGFELFARTSRRVALSEGGAAFMPHAQAMIRADADAVRAARRIQSGLASVIRIGACEYQAALPPRRRLIERMLERHPEVRLEIFHGAVPDLLARLRREELDLVLSLDIGQVDRADLEVARFGLLNAHLLIPREDPLALLDEVPLSRLGGRSFLLSPGRHDPEAIEFLARTLRDHGVSVGFAPEADRATIERVAQLRRACCLRWEEGRLPPRDWLDMRIVPFAGDPFVGTFDAARRRGRTGAAIDKLLAVAAMP